jgi:hypothetical protein
MVSACSQLPSKFREEDVFSLTSANAAHCYPIYSRATTASIGGDSAPGASQIAWSMTQFHKLRYGPLGLALLHWYSFRCTLSSQAFACWSESTDRCSDFRG